MSTYNPNGQGLLFSGFPLDVRKFYWILAQEGCHPKASHRILNRINNQGEDRLTVTSTLKFNWIKEQLNGIGVKMSFITPLENWSAKYEDGTWNEKDLPVKFQK